MGIIQRMNWSREQYNPDEYIETATFGAEIAPQLLRKLRSIATLIDTAVEVEDFKLSEFNVGKH